MNINIVGFGPLDERLCFEFFFYSGALLLYCACSCCFGNFLQMQFLWYMWALHLRFSYC